jgi:hypothetical protein
VIRYVVDVGTAAPIRDARCTVLETLGFRRDGAYRTEQWTGEVWVDEAGTTMVAVYRGFGRVLASVHSVLEDGTHVSTEEKAPFRWQLALAPTMNAPIDRTSVRFPEDAVGVKELLAAHHAHVAEIESARRSKATTDASVTTFVDMRNEAVARVAANHAAFMKTGQVLGALGFAGCVLIGVLQEINARPQLVLWTLTGVAMGLVYFVFGTLFLGPALVRKGSITPEVVRSIDRGAADERAAVTSLSARGAWLLAVLWTIGVGLIIGAAVKGAGVFGLVLEAFVLVGLGQRAVSAIRDREGRRERRVKWEVVDGILQVDGERPLPLAEISAAIRTDAGMPALVVLDRRGHVALRLTGEAKALDAIRDAIHTERASLPVARDLRTLVALLAPVLIAIIGAFGLPRLASTFHGLAATLLALAPLANLRPRLTVEVGVDGVVLEGRFVAFAEIASLTVVVEQLEVVERSGKRTVLTLAHPGSGAEIAHRWKLHVERTEDRDEAEVVRRRVAIDTEGDDVPYRARVATPEELGEALLDSSEARSVRVRAARRLVRDDSEAASRVREEVEERVVDPDVREELRREPSRER